jgi:phage-related minor tail protein
MAKMPTEIDELTISVRADTVPFRNAMRDLSNDTDRFSRAVTRAFRDAVAGGKSFEDVLRNLALRIAGIALDRALQPIGTGIGSLLSNMLTGGGKLLPFANGGIVNAPLVRPFADGGVLTAPTVFPVPGGLGLAGEAGPEAILPLTRGSDGRLGVRAERGRPTSVTLNVVTQDAESFRKSEAQLTAMLARAVGRGRRGL